MHVLYWQLRGCVHPRLNTCEANFLTNCAISPAVSDMWPNTQSPSAEPVPRAETCLLLVGFLRRALSFPWSVTDLTYCDISFHAAFPENPKLLLNEAKMLLLGL